MDSGQEIRATVIYGSSVSLCGGDLAAFDWVECWTAIGLDIRGEKQPERFIVLS